MQIHALFALMLMVASVAAVPTAKEGMMDGSTATKRGKASSTDVAASTVVASSTAAAASAVAASNSTAATGTSTAASATRTRLCDMGDQSLAAGLQASVLVGIGQQASVVTLQGALGNASSFADGVTRLQQFVDTAGLQLQMAQGIADDGSFAQTQLKLLAASQTSQAASVKALNATGAATAATTNQTLTDLGASFLASTNNAQDGAEQALIDCGIPLNAISG